MRSNCIQNVYPLSNSRWQRIISVLALNTLRHAQCGGGTSLFDLPQANSLIKLVKPNTICHSQGKPTASMLDLPP